jgi:hypothetical protein
MHPIGSWRAAPFLMFVGATSPFHSFTGFGFICFSIEQNFFHDLGETCGEQVNPQNLIKRVG